MTKKSFHVAVVGATGIVGKEILSILAERRFPVASIKALASEKSKGEKVDFGEEDVSVEELSPAAFSGVDIAFFAINSELAKKYCAIAAEKGVVCIDKSGAHRMLDDVPLVVAGVNSKEIARYKARNIIASPNCTATPLVQVLAPLHHKVGIGRVVMCSYQAVSGAGQKGIEELEQQVRHMFNLQEAKSEVFGEPISFNAIPYIQDEEQKVIEESRKILGLPNLPIGVTCVRIPVFNGHSEAVHIECHKPISVDEVRDLLGKSSGLMVMDDPKNNLFPTPLKASGEDMTLVGRIRQDDSVKNGIALWLSSDNLRTGAALNGVRIGEILCKEYLS